MSLRAPMSLISLVILTLVFNTASPLTAAAVSPGKPPLFPPENARVRGESELAVWRRSGGSAGTGCWQRSMQRFEALSLDCAAFEEQARSLLALSITHCHMEWNTREFPSQDLSAVIAATGCDIDRAYKARLRAPKNHSSEYPSNESSDQTSASDSASDGSSSTDAVVDDSSEVETIIRKCKGAMSGSALAAYISVYNHLDNVCFFLHSELWQQRTERTVSRVMDQLQTLDERHAELISQTDRLKGHLETGNAHLQLAFGEMREQVNQESRKILSVFDETFSLVNRLFLFQKSVIARISGLETLLIYALLIILSFYMTTADATRRARATLFFVWTVMAAGEFCLRQYFEPALVRIARHPMGVRILTTVLNIDSLGRGKGHSSVVSASGEQLLTSVLRHWRYSCGLLSVWIWIRAYWAYRDPTGLLVRALEDLKEQVKAIQYSANDERYLDDGGYHAGFHAAGSTPTAAAAAAATLTSIPSSLLMANGLTRRRYRRQTINISGNDGEGNKLYRKQWDPLSSDADDSSYSSSSERCCCCCDSSSSRALRPSAGGSGWEASSAGRCDRCGGGGGGLCLSLSESDSESDGELVEGDLSCVVRRECSDCSAVADDSADENGVMRVLRRRNPPRIARPVLYRPPRIGCLEDVEKLKLNSLLLFETADDFVDIFERRERQREMLPPIEAAADPPVHFNVLPDQQRTTTTPHTTVPTPHTTPSPISSDRETAGQVISSRPTTADSTAAVVAAKPRAKGRPRKVAAVKPAPAPPRTRSAIKRERLD